MRSKNQKSTRYLTLSALFAALSVLLLTLGSVFQVIDLTMAALASLLVVLAVIEMGGKYPYLIFAVSAVLAFVLLPLGTPTLAYVLFFGYYPIVKALLEKRLSVPLCWAAKLLVFLASLAVAFLLARFLLTPDMEIGYILWLTAALAVVVFAVYDVALTRLITVYLLRWRHRLRIFK